MKSFICRHCGQQANRETGAVNRANRTGMALYCGKLCSGFGRRIEKSREQKVVEKAAYDAKYRARNADKLRAEKAAYYAANFDREKERVYRAVRMPKHVEYCRRPEYRKWKAEYDHKHRARSVYGDFAESALILNDLETEINERSTFTERAILKGTLNKHQERRREYDRQTQRS